jgi:hypothetical protein
VTGRNQNRPDHTHVAPFWTICKRGKKLPMHLASLQKFELTTLKKKKKKAEAIKGVKIIF